MDPKNLQTQLAAGIGAVLGLMGACYFLPSQYKRVVVPLLFFVLFVGSFVFGILAKRKAKREELSKQLAEQGGAAPRDISAPSQRARVDDLRKRFQEGLREYESRGKDLYSLPWYLICGEPGSGKTEAIRHSEIGFPAGLNEYMQGAGGTINMNWWFTNKAVILDTAGRLMFEEVKAGETGEWREFLKLLKKARPNCPINGLFLTISAETLIKDTADKIGEKARQIAKQLDVIQRALDVRFPVYVLVTKCDLAIGFREFFDGIADPALQHQLIGWSSPEDLDAPFRPDLMAEHLETVARRLQRRRLALLRDPAPQTEGGRRITEVDQLYALPTSISKTIAERLERYLNIIFEQGEWSAKPVFFRGIYFTSSMREGSALDADLAEALGMPVTELPPTRSFEKERSFFLRDLFIYKAFREAGLVTGATNARRMLQQRQFIVFGVASFALLVLGAFSWIGMRDLTRNVGKEMSLWRSTTNAWEQGMWNPIVVPQGTSGIYRYRGDESFGQGKSTLADFHAELRDRAARPLRVSLVFRPISWIASVGDLNRKEAQRVVFERSVLGPLVVATRNKMIRGETRPDSVAQDAASAAGQARLLAALSSLIRLEAEGAGNGHTLTGTNEAQQYLDSWLNYVTETNRITDTNLVSVMNWVYSPQGGGNKKWPATSLLGGNSLGDNLAIDRGLQQYFASAKSSQKVLNKRLKLIEDVRSDANAYLSSEQKIYNDVLAEHQRTGSREVSVADYGSIKPARIALDRSLENAKQAELFQGGKFQLMAAYSNLLAECYLNSREALLPIYNALPQNSNKELFNEIRRLLDSQQANGICDQIQRSSEADKGIADVDVSVLSAASDVMAYRQRSDLYQAAVAIGSAGPGELGPLIAKLDEGLAPESLNRLPADQASKLKQLREKIPAFCAARMQAQLTRIAVFPVVARSVERSLLLEEVKEAQMALQDFVKVVDAPLLREAPEIKALKPGILRYATTVRGILGEDGNPVNCTIGLDAEQTRETVFVYRRIEVVAEKSFGMIETTTQKYQDLCKVPLDKDITIHVRKFAQEAPVSSRNFSSWGALGLIASNREDAKRSNDGRTWVVKYPISKTESLNLRLEFERPLPDLNQWVMP